jgi:hypothetical protein
MLPVSTTEISERNMRISRLRGFIACNCPHFDRARACAHGAAHFSSSFVPNENVHGVAV